MPEKLLTIQEASSLLAITEEGVKELVEKGALPAYKIDGRFLRFRREQIEAIKNELSAKTTTRLPKRPKKEYSKRSRETAYAESFSDRVSDFFYFNDFYLISGAIILVIMWIIFRP
ncbi:MAG: helix-turn-helix domain-containing protein [Candidatus Omnitrophica bacterium]|nr:helix-turn-helix domain-containing protein [Candidatus Omnitrophota bacterium]